MPGPVSEGSIVAYIGADDGDYQEKMRAAQATAEELGRTDPTVTVHADTGEAMAKIDAVAAQTDALSRAKARVDAAARSAANAASTQYIAELRLKDLQEKGTATALQMAAAQEAVARASRNAEAAELRQIAAETALKDLQSAPKAPQDKTPSTSGGGSAPWLAIGIGAAIPLLADLAGYAAATTGALLGMGAAGVLAFVGIKDEMESGSAAGQEYMQGLNLLKSDLGDLADTAQNAVRPGLEAAFASIHNDLPDLNTEIAGFGNGLSRVASFTVDGLVTGFKVLNPMFMQAQSYLVGLAQDWDQWVHGGGLVQWGEDVQRVFPLVADTLGTLGHVALNLISDLAPLGTVFLELLDGAAHVADFLTTVLGPAFGPVTLGVIAAVLAFKNFETIAPILDAVTLGMFSLSGAQAEVAVTAEAAAAGEAAVEAASGPAGWVVLAASAAVGLLAGALVQGAQASATAASAMKDYSSAVEQDNGVVGEATQKTLAANLATSGAIQLAKEFGMTTNMVTDAITQGGQAKDDLVGRLNRIAQAHTQAIGTGRSYRIVQDEQATSAKKLIDIIDQQNSSLDASISQYQRQASVMGDLALQGNRLVGNQQGLGIQFGLTSQQIAAATLQQQNLALQTSWVSTQLNIENTAAQNLSNELQLMNNGALNVAMAQTAQAAATNTLTDSFKKNGKEIQGTTAAAIANQQALQAKIQADQQEAEAIAKSTGSQQAGTQALADSKKALENQLKAFGDLTPQVQAYIDKLYAIPKSVYTDVVVTTAGALSQINALKAAEQGLNYVATASVGAVAKADGGPVYAATGMFVPQGTDTVPAMLSPGEMVIKQKSAAYDPQFMNAYNADPEKALAAVRAQGRGDVHLKVEVTGVQQTEPHVLGAIIGNRSVTALAGLPGINR